MNLFKNKIGNLVAYSAIPLGLLVFSYGVVYYADKNIKSHSPQPKTYPYDEKDVNNDGYKDLVLRSPKDRKILRVLLGTSQKDTYRDDLSLTYRLRAQEDSLESRLKENKK